VWVNTCVTDPSLFSRADPFISNEGSALNSFLSMIRMSEGLALETRYPMSHVTMY